MPSNGPSRYALHQWNALNEARVIFQTCRRDPVAQEAWRGLIAFDADQMDEWMEAHVESKRHRQSILSHLEKRAACLKEFDRLVKKERLNGHQNS